VAVSTREQGKRYGIRIRRKVLAGGVKSAIIDTGG
jgi:hypothetical protein